MLLLIKSPKQQQIDVTRQTDVVKLQSKCNWLSLNVPPTKAVKQVTKYYVSLHKKHVWTHSIHVYTMNIACADIQREKGRVVKYLWKNVQVNISKFVYPWPFSSVLLLQHHFLHIVINRPGAMPDVVRLKSISCQIL